MTLDQFLSKYHELFHQAVEKEEKKKGRKLTFDEQWIFTSAFSYGFDASEEITRIENSEKELLKEKGNSYLVE